MFGETSAAQVHIRQNLSGGSVVHFRASVPGQQSARAVVVRRSNGSLQPSDGPKRCARFITELPNEPYDITHPILVRVTQNTLEDFTASFDEANIAMPGETLEDSIGNLLAHVLDVYEMLERHSAENLAQGPREQLATLKKYVKAK